MTGRLNIFTLPTGTPFLRSVARSLLADASLGGLFAPSPKLEAMRIFVPNHRARDALCEALLQESRREAMLMPDIIALGDVDDEDVSEEGMSDPFHARAIDPLSRRVRLAALVRTHAARLKLPTLTPAAYAELAASLAALLDDMQRMRADMSRLDTLAPEDMSEHWQITRDLLRLITRKWPDTLARAGLSDPIARRNALLDAQTRRLRDTPPSAPVLALGSSASTPATAELLACIAALPQGAVVLPGLDETLDEAAWEAVDAGHPQYALKQFLARVGVSRAQVRLWPGALERDALAKARAMLIAEALRPAETTDAWTRHTQDAAADMRRASGGLTLIEAEAPREEAQAIALVLRHAVDARRRAALITPDRWLARRVAAEMKRWGIVIDDSAGVPLNTMPAFVFLRLVAQVVARDFAPVALLSLLKHPLCACGFAPPDVRARARVLEVRVLRGVAPAGGLEALRASCTDKDMHDIRALLDRLRESCAPLVETARMSASSFDACVRAHIAAAEALAQTDTLEASRTLWSGYAGRAALEFMDTLESCAAAMGKVAMEDYPALLDSLGAAQAVRRPFASGERLSIWGTLEARLQDVDVAVLGGLNENVWPSLPATDPWMSRKMRAALGLEVPEHRIGLAAQDLTQIFPTRHLYLTRARKDADGAPAHASRFVLRLDTLLSTLGMKGVPRDARFASWSAALDAPDATPPAPKPPALPVSLALPVPPAPKPPLVLRPKRLSVTQIETLIHNPYAIFARHVLRLKPLEPLEKAPDALARGTLFHEALEAFARACPDTLPDDAQMRLKDIGARILEKIKDDPAAQMFWQARFDAMAAAFVRLEEGTLRAHPVRVHAEIKGEMLVPDTGVRLTARADRIDVRGDGAAIYDYKTGAVASARKIAEGFAPQLPLEGAMLTQGGFEGLGALPLLGLAHIVLKASGTGRADMLKRIDDAATRAEEAWAGLRRLLAAYARAKTPYLSRPRSADTFHGEEYDLLARVKVWRAGGTGTDTGESL